MGKSTYDAYKPDIAAKICERLSEGEPLRAICRDEGMPAWRTIYSWMYQDEKLAAAIAHARELGYDAIAEDMLNIADDATNDWMERLGKEGQPVGWQLNGDHVQRSKLRIETRFKLLSKWMPNKYGERTELHHTGEVDIATALAAARMRLRKEDSTPPDVKTPEDLL